MTNPLHRGHTMAIYASETSTCPVRAVNQYAAAVTLEVYRYENFGIYQYRLSELGKLLYESNILHITSYFYEEVIYYNCILLYQNVTPL